MAKNKTVRVTEEELAALQAFRESAKASDENPIAEAVPVVATAAQQALADAFVSAIERTRPPAKKTVATRKPKTPWDPTDGSPRLKLKRRMFHHGIPIERVTNEEIELLNQIKPGVYCDGFVHVTLRKDRGLDIHYPVKTNSQRLKLINTYGVRRFSELLERLIDEKANPKKYRKVEDSDLYED